jgi:hypothetical protein
VPHHINLDTLILSRGRHPSRADGVCLFEAVAWWANQKHTDSPRCVSYVLRTFGTALNDILPSERRQRLRRLIPLLPGTAGDGRDEIRSYMALDWMIRTWAPAWLGAAGLTTEASALRELRQIADMVTAQQAGPVMRAAQQKAAAIRITTRDVIPAVAVDYAVDAAWDVPAMAARAAARDAVRAAAWDAARVTARDAAMNVACTRTLTWEALRPTVDLLQDSAVALFAAMIDPS